jgi:hypothetical protein
MTPTHDAGRPLSSRGCVLLASPPECNPLFVDLTLDLDYDTARLRSEQMCKSGLRS